MSFKPSHLEQSAALLPYYDSTGVRTGTCVYVLNQSHRLLKQYDYTD